MDPIASFSGLSSGMDWQTMVDSIIEVESRVAYRYGDKVLEIRREQDAWNEFRTRVEAMESSAADLADGSAFKVFSTSASGSSLTVTAGEEAMPGSFTARVFQLATNEKLGGDVFSSRSEPLGLSGEFLVNGASVLVTETDTLTDVVGSINRANTGLGASGVTASLISKAADQYHLVLTSTSSGASGISLADGADGVLRSLGLLDDSSQVKTFTSNGALSDGLSAPDGVVATLRGLSAPPPSGDVTIGSVSVTLDLSTMSLSDIADSINSAASGAGSAVTASVVSGTNDDGDMVYRLDIDGTTSFSDANHILETLGILEGGRGAVAQEIQAGIAFTEGDASTVATASTSLSDLWVGGAAGNVTAGDTLTLNGTRGDGTTFTKTYTVGASDALQDILDALNAGSDAFGAGTRPATASIDAEGHLVVNDGTGGYSRLGFSITAHNEGGGTLDFGDFSVSQAGRTREIVAGQDAQVEVDGTVLTRSTNTLSDIVPGLTLNLLSATGEATAVSVARDSAKISKSITAFVDAYNELSEWVSDQFSGVGAEEGVDAKPLSGDGVLRSLKSKFHSAMRTELAAAVGGDLTRLASIGIEIDKEGLYQIDAADLTAALQRDTEAVMRLFGTYGTGSVSDVTYIAAGDDTASGVYALEITQAATRGSATGAGFGGTYVDDATADTLTVKDLGSESEYSISLSDGMTLADIVSALNTEFAEATVHQVQATQAMYSDATGTAATDSTLLQDLFDGTGTSFGVANGDVLSISGTRQNGSSFFQELAVTDISTQTLGDLRSAIQTAVGSSDTVTWEGGLLTVTAEEAGRSSLDLSVSSTNAGGGSLSFGTMDSVTVGRDTVDITASEEGGELNLLHGDYGSTRGFEVSFTAGGTDGTASLGLAADTYAGTDVQGTVGGYAATGDGQILTGDESTPVAGLMILYKGADTGSAGDVTFSRGIGSVLERLAGELLKTGPGTISGITDRMDSSIQRINDRIDDIEFRLDKKRADLIKRFAKMEEALARAQQQSSWLAAQFGLMSTKSSSSN